jgi:hypothetical protein
MKASLYKALVVTAVIHFITAFGLFAQGFDNISTAFKSGDAASIAKNFEGNVEITIKNSATSYSKSQAEIVLKNFFASHQPKSFSIVHQGTSPEGSKYFIGNLGTHTGNYKTYVYAKAVKGGLTIQEIRFEEQ